MRKHLPVVAAALSSFVASPALADGPAATTRSSWSGLQTLALDGGAILAAVVIDDPAGLLACYAIGPPIVHWAHGNVLNGFASLALRITAPTVGGFSARAAAGDDEAAAAGAVAGALFAAVLDAALLARIENAPRHASSRASSRASVRCRAAVDSSGSAGRSEARLDTTRHDPIN